MDVIFGNRGIGKTTQLIRRAAQVNGIVVGLSRDFVYLKCRQIGVFVDSLSYEEYLQMIIDKKCIDKPIFIDDINVFLSMLDHKIKSYTVDLVDNFYNKED